MIWKPQVVIGDSIDCVFLDAVAEGYSLFLFLVGYLTLSTYWSNILVLSLREVDDELHCCFEVYCWSLVLSMTHKMRGYHSGSSLILECVELVAACCYGSEVPFFSLQPQARSAVPTARILLTSLPTCARTYFVEVDTWIEQMKILSECKLWTEYSSRIEHDRKDVVGSG